VAANLEKLAKAMKITGVYGYEYGCEHTFAAARRLGIARYYDLPIAYWTTAQRLLAEESQRLPDWEPTLVGTRDSKQKHERRSRELELADLVICPSKFVAESLPAGFRQRKEVVIAHFGSPQAAPGSDDLASRRLDRRLRVLFVGSLTQRKGLADLFAAIKLLNRRDIELIVMGSPILPMDFYKKQFPDFTYEPTRPHREVLSLMRSCDVLVLPSIVEGRALVMQEAMSQGLPLIITPNTGGEDLVEDGRTGFLVPIRAPATIAMRLAWFADHRQDTEQMGKWAKEKANSYTWGAYGAKISKAIQLKDPRGSSYEEVHSRQQP
jgi:glycosyltransferase involved in cell wall biosynthesis